MQSNLKLMRKEIVAEDAMIFYFSKPQGLAFRAGQPPNFTLFDPSLIYHPQFEFFPAAHGPNAALAYTNFASQN